MTQALEIKVTAKKKTHSAVNQQCAGEEEQCSVPCEVKNRKLKIY